MKKILFFAILILATVLRFWQLGENPLSLDWDEASLGYNAYSILKTGKDEYGTFFPLSIRSFGDYKPALYTYLTIPSVTIFGLTEFATRLPSALFGIAAVVVSFFIIKELFPDKKNLPYLAMFLLAVSPWHIQFSRIAFEANLGIFFFISGVYLFLRSLKNKLYFFLSFFSFAASMYSYHSPRLVVPLFLVGAVLIFGRQIWQKKETFIAAAIIMAMVVFPIVKQIASTSARFGSVSVINPAERLEESIKAIEYDQPRNDLLGKLIHNRRIIYTREILAGYLDHFNFDFLFLNGDPPGRHHAAGMGMLYWWDFLFLIIGFISLVKRQTTDREKLVLWWFLVAPSASSLTSGTPHAVRALLYLPTFQIFIGLGILKILNSLSLKLKNHLTMKPFNHFILKYLIIIITCFTLIINMYYYMTMYWIHSPVEYASEWQYGYKQAVEVAKTYEDEVGKIIVTYRYDQPYIFFLFYNKIDPTWYQSQWRGGEIQRFNRDFDIYEFRNIEWERDSSLTNTLFIGTPGEIPADATGRITDIPFPDGSVAFRIVKR